MTSEQRERLIILRDYLVQQGESLGNRFYMAKWATDENCCTAGCAAGHAATIPVLKEQGFHLLHDEDEGRLYPVFDKYRGYDACAAFFGTYKPFDHRLYRGVALRDITPAVVVEKIEEVLADAPLEAAP